MSTHFGVCMELLWLGNGSLDVPASPDLDLVGGQHGQLDTEVHCLP